MSLGKTSLIKSSVRVNSCIALPLPGQISCLHFTENRVVTSLQCDVRSVEIPLPRFLLKGFFGVEQNVFDRFV